MKGFLIVVYVFMCLSILNDWVLKDEVERIKQDIVDIKKDFSYDPKDAK